LVSKIDLGLFALAALAVFLIIRGAGQAFAGIKNPFEGIELPSIGDITFPEINFPEINLPSFDFLGGLFGQDDSSSIAGETVETDGLIVTIPEDTVIDPDTGIVTSSTPPTGILTSPITFDEKLFAETRAGVFDTLFENLGLDPKFAQSIVSEAKTFSDLSAILFKANQGFFTNQEKQFVTEIKENEGGGLSVIPKIQDIVSDLPAGFVGGGPSFIGGSIFETPIANLSLSQIIDKFMVTASQAANIKAIAGDDFGDFDFGTNTGGGIGSIIQTIQGLSGLGGNVSDSQFQGLTAQEIANKLTGGNISNF